MSRRTLGPISRISGDSIPSPSRALGSITHSLAVVTKEFIVYVAGEGATFPYDAAVGDFVTGVMQDTSPANFMFHVPHDFNSLTDAVAVMIPDATETIQWDLTTDFGASGEAFNANSDSEADATLAVTASQLAECDISAGLTAIAAGDYVGVAMTSNTTNIRPILLRVRYT